MAKRKEIIFEVTDIFPEKGLTWDALTKSMLPLIEATLEYFKKMEREESEELRRIKEIDCKSDELKVE